MDADFVAGGDDAALLLGVEQGDDRRDVEADCQGSSSPAGCSGLVCSGLVRAVVDMMPLLDLLGLSLQRAMPGARAQPRRRPLSASGKEDYMSAMESLLTVLIPLAMLATLVVLGFGVVQMIRGGNPRRSNKLMQYRVVFQGLALLLFALLMMVFKH